MVILFLRGLDNFIEGMVPVSSGPAPPRDRALLRDLLFVEDETSLRSGDGWIGAFSRRRREGGVAVAPAPNDSLVARGDRRAVVGGDISLQCVLECFRWRCVSWRYIGGVAGDLFTFPRLELCKRRFMG